MYPLSTNVLRLEIDQRWTALEMSRLFNCLRGFYNLRLGVQKLVAGAFPEFGISLTDDNDVDSMKRLREYLLGCMSDYHIDDSEQLIVVRIRYESPGIVDVAGIGQVIGHLKDFILRLIELKLETRKRELENNERALKNERLEIENKMLRLKVEQQLKAGEKKESLEMPIQLTEPERENLLNYLMATNVPSFLKILDMSTLYADLAYLIGHGKIEAIMLYDSEKA